MLEGALCYYSLQVEWAWLVAFSTTQLAFISKKMTVKKGRKLPKIGRKSSQAHKLNVEAKYLATICLPGKSLRDIWPLRSSVSKFLLYEPKIGSTSSLRRLALPWRLCLSPTFKDALHTECYTTRVVAYWKDTMFKKTSRRRTSSLNRTELPTRWRKKIIKENEWPTSETAHMKRISHSRQTNVQTRISKKDKTIR